MAVSGIPRPRGGSVDGNTENVSAAGSLNKVGNSKIVGMKVGVFVAGKEEAGVSAGRSSTDSESSGMSGASAGGGGSGPGSVAPPLGENTSTTNKATRSKIPTTRRSTRRTRAA